MIDCRKQVLTPNAVRVAEVRDTCQMDELVMAELDGNLKVLSAESCANAFQSVVLGNANVRFSLHCFSSSACVFFSRSSTQFSTRLPKGWQRK